MQQTDCLLVIQNIIYFSCETIPSKVYEYLLAGRPIIGLVYNNEELDSMLTEHDHLAVPANNVQAITEAIEKVLDDFMQEEQNENGPAISEKNSGSLPTVADAVQKLIALAEGTQRTKGSEETEGETSTCC